jgi:glycosyltransferase 2 family protein
VTGWHRRHLRLLSLLGSLLVVGGLIYLSRPTHVASQLRGVDWLLAVPALLGLIASHLLQVQTWRLLSQRMCNHRLPPVRAAMAYFAGQAFGSFTPGNIGGDVYRASVLRNESGGWRPAAAPILAQRLASYGSLLLMAGVVGWLRLASLVSVAGLVALTAATVLFGSLAIKAASESILPRLRRMLFADIAERKSFAKLALDYSPSLLLSVLFHVTGVVLSYVLLLSLGQTPPLFPTLGVLVLVRVATLMPITPFGLGVQEGSLVLLLPMLGVSADAALALSVLSRLSMLGTVMLGITAFLATRVRAVSTSAPTQDTQSFAPNEAGAPGVLNLELQLPNDT